VTMNAAHSVVATFDRTMGQSPTKISGSKFAGAVLR
jgi:hypothetical protein